MLVEQPHHMRASHRPYTLMALLLCLASLLNTTELQASYHAHANSLTGSGSALSLPLHWTLVTVQCPLSSPQSLILSFVTLCWSSAQLDHVLPLVNQLFTNLYTTQHPSTTPPVHPVSIIDHLLCFRSYT